MSQNQDSLRSSAEPPKQNQQATQLGTRPAGPNPSSAIRPSVQYMGSQAQIHPAQLFARVQMIPAAQLSNAAVQVMPSYVGTAYRPMNSTADVLPGTLAPLGTAQQPMRSLPTQSVTNSPATQQLQRPTSGQSLLHSSSQPMIQHVSSVRPGFVHQQQQPAQIYSPMSEEDRKVLPWKSLKRKAESTIGDPRAEIEPNLEVALVNMADEFITNAVAFSCGLAKSRKADRLEAADVACYLDRTWHLHIPGFGGPLVPSSRRYSAGSSHQARSAIVRKETASASKAAAESD